MTSKHTRKHANAVAAVYAAGYGIPSLDNHGQVPIDVERLIETRLAIEANSGGGKSWAVRRILEQTSTHCQQIVIDPEDEFHTLREHSEYILCAPSGGDVAISWNRGKLEASVRFAALLARRLLELNVSAIIAIYELGDRRAEFVEAFVDGLMHAPRDLWHPAMVVIDEASKFCPEGDKAASTAAVVNLMTTGRKRGFMGLLACQRISTVNKSALAECNNIMIGRTGLDIDIARASSILGLKLADAKSILKNLEAGEFFAYGPAISREVIRLSVGRVITTHPRAGQRAIPPAPPTAKIVGILAKIADLPAEAAEEAKTVEELRAQVAKLKVENAKAAKGVRDDVVGADKYAKLLDHANTQKRESDSLRQQLDAADGRIRHLKGGLAKARSDIDLAIKLEDSQSPIPARSVPGVKIYGDVSKGEHLHVEYDPKTPLVLDRDKFLGDPSANGGDLSRMERTFLTALAQHPSGLHRNKLLVHAGYSMGGAPIKCWAKLLREGLAESAEGRHMRITAAGIAKLGTWDPLPTGRELFEHIMSGSRLSGMERALLKVIEGMYPADIDRNGAVRAAGYSMGGAPIKALAKLIALDYVTIPARTRLRVAEELVG